MRLCECDNNPTVNGVGYCLRCKGYKQGFEDRGKEPQKVAGEESNSTNLLDAKGRAKLFIDANVWDGEDRAGCHGDMARFTPDELQELIDDMLEHLGI